jgi:hypothetical protein
LVRVIILITWIPLVRASVSTATAHPVDPLPTRGFACPSRFRRLSCSGPERVPALQGWRHGVHSRSLGGTFYIPSKDRVQLVSRPAGRFLLHGLGWQERRILLCFYPEPPCHPVCTWEWVFSVIGIRLPVQWWLPAGRSFPGFFAVCMSRAKPADSLFGRDSY